MDDIKKLVIATAFRKMLKGGHFSICTVDGCLDLAGIIDAKGSKPHKMLHALHCVDFSDMPAEVAAMVPVWISQCFNGVSVEDWMAAAKPASNNNGKNVLQHLQ